MLAQRGNLDDISAASPDAHERIMEESRRRTVEVVTEVMSKVEK
jgi:hypothetical protein